MAAVRQLWELRDDRPLFVSASVLLGVSLLAYYAIDWHLRGAGISTPFRYYDWGAYYGAVTTWEAGEPLYEAEDGDFHGEYLYAPVFIGLFDLFLTDAVESGRAWATVTLLTTWVGLQAIARAAGLRLHAAERVLLLVLLFGFQPALFGFKMGQVSLFLAGLLAMAFATLEWDRRHDSRAARIASGGFTTLGSSMKLFYAASGAHLLRNPDRFFGAILALIGLIGVSLTTYGVDPHVGYLEVLLWGKGWEPGRHPSLWMPAYFRPLWVLGTAAIYLKGVVVLAVIALVLAVRPPTAGSGQGTVFDAEREVFALGVAAIPIVAPRLYTYDLVVLLPATAALVAVELDRAAAGRPAVPALPVVGVLLCHVHAYGLYALAHYPTVWPGASVVEWALPVLQPAIYGTVAIFGLAVYRTAEYTPLREWFMDRGPSRHAE